MFMSSSAIGSTMVGWTRQVLTNSTWAPSQPRIRSAAGRPSSCSQAAWTSSPSFTYR